MKITLKNIRLQIDLLEMMVDNYHRAIVNNELTPCSHQDLLKTAMTISYNLVNIDGGKHLTIKSPEFQRMMVIVKNINNMKQK